MMYFFGRHIIEYKKKLEFYLVLKFLSPVLYESFKYIEKVVKK